MKVIDLIGSGLTSVRNRLADQVWERRLGIQTCGNVMIHVGDSHLYGTFAYASIRRVLNNLHWKPNDVFVDIGCGKGRVVCCAASMFRARKIIGIDLDESLCAKARHNAAAMKGRRTPIEIVHARAQDYDYRACTKFFMFHPFGARTLTTVLEVIEASLREHPRPIDLVYLNPVHDDVVAERSAMSHVVRWRKRNWGGLKHDVSFWSNVPVPVAASPAHSLYMSALGGLEPCTSMANEMMVAMGAL